MIDVYATIFGTSTLIDMVYDKFILSILGEYCSNFNKEEFETTNLIMKVKTIKLFIWEEKMAKSKPSTTKRSGNGSHKRK